MSDDPSVSQQNPRRVLHVLGSLNPGGVENWLRQMSRHSAEFGWAFDFCVLDSERGSYADELEGGGSLVISCPLQPRPLFAPRLYRLLRRTQYEIVHSHVHHFSGFVLEIAERAGVRVRIAHSHNSRDGRSDSQARRLYRRLMAALLRRSMTLGLACSTEAAEPLVGADSAECQRIHLLPYGVDLDLLRRLHPDRNRLRAQFGIPAGAPVVGHVGRLEPQKNQAFLMRVAAEAVQRIRGVRFVIVGEGRLREKLQQQVEELGLGGCVRFAGQRDDVPGLMVGLFDAFVLPSLHEGLPLAAIEAQAAGLPTLVSDQVTHEAAILPPISYREGLGAGPVRWASTLQRMLEARRLSPAEACHALEDRGFSIRSCLRELGRLYEAALGARKARQGDAVASLEAKACRSGN